jgi:hypothetical protein
MQCVDVNGIAFERRAVTFFGVVQAAVTMRRERALENWLHDG